MTRFSIGVPIVLVAFSVLLVGCPPPDGIKVTSEALIITEPGGSDTLIVKNTSAKNVTLDIAVTAEQVWLTVDGLAEVTFSLEGKAEKELTIARVAVAEKADFATGTVTIVATKDGVEVETLTESVDTGTPAYNTQSFDPALVGKIVLFTESDTPDFYTAGIGDLPEMRVAVDDPLMTALTFVSSDAVPVLPLDGATVSLYGVDYETFYVGNDGRITFEETAGAAADAELFLEHFATPSVSGLFAPLSGGDVYVAQLDDRMLIAYDGVQQLDETGANSFQIELFLTPAPAEVKADGPSIALAWFGVDADLVAVVGLSDGNADPAPDVTTADDLTAADPADNTAPVAASL